MQNTIIDLATRRVPQTSPRWISVADTAKLVRAALKTAFPGVRFSVKSRAYSGGASIDVRWTDGPTSAQVKRAVMPYEGAEYDGVTDTKTYKAALLNGDRVRYEADNIHCERDLSAELLTRCAAIVADRYGVPAPAVHTEASRYSRKPYTVVWIDRDSGPSLGNGLDRTPGDKAFHLACETDAR